MRILISAGEASGDMYGAQLIEALRRAVLRNSAELRSAGQPGAAVPTQASCSTQAPQLEFFGVGGERMRAAGCETVVNAKDLSVVGITEILSHLPKIWGLFHKLIAEANRRKPDLAIVIDSPAFNWRVARQIHKRGVPVVYYVCPQFWAWRQGRVRLLRKYVTKALVIFPFEEKFYRERGVDASFVGHPLADLPCLKIDRATYAAQHGLDSAKQWITIMPGSRVKEVRVNLPEILNAASRLGPSYEFLLPVAPTLDRQFLQGLIGRRVEIHLVDEALPAMSQSRAGIIASGTATVEAAVMGLPFVMVYRVSPLTYALGRPRVKVRHFAMPNLIAGEEVVPEFVQDGFTAENVVNELQKIVPEGPDRAKIIQELAQVKLRLRGETQDDLHPGDRAAQEVLALLPGARARTSAPTSEG